MQYWSLYNTECCIFYKSHYIYYAMVYYFDGILFRWYIISMVYYFWCEFDNYCLVILRLLWETGIILKDCSLHYMHSNVFSMLKILARYICTTLYRYVYVLLFVLICLCTAVCIDMSTYCYLYRYVYVLLFVVISMAVTWWEAVKTARSLEIKFIKGSSRVKNSLNFVGKSWKKMVRILHKIIKEFFIQFVEARLDSVWTS